MKFFGISSAVVSNASQVLSFHASGNSSQENHFAFRLSCIRRANRLINNWQLKKRRKQNSFTYPCFHSEYYDIYGASKMKSLLLFDYIKIIKLRKCNCKLAHSLAWMFRSTCLFFNLRILFDV